MRSAFSQLSWRQFGPTMGRATGYEIARASLGIAIALAVIEVLVVRTGLGEGFGLHMIAPFAATALLLIGVPNSPLAQPWSAVVGNGVSAFAGILAVTVANDIVLQVFLAGGLALFGMHLLRAMHPPGGAVALTAVLSPDAAHQGFSFVLTPVMLGTALLVVIAIIYGAVTGRHYPFRLAEDEAPYRGDEAHRDPLGLSRDDLADLLAEFRQSPNIGVEDLARLIAGAEDRAASLRLGNLTCSNIMSRNLVTVRPKGSFSDVARLFARNGFTSIPVVNEDGTYRGLIFQLDLIRRAVADTDFFGKQFPRAFGRLLLRGRREAVAAELMRVDGPQKSPESAVMELLPLLAEGVREAVPILKDGKIVGIVTRTDLVGCLERELVSAQR